MGSNCSLGNRAGVPWARLAGETVPRVGAGDAVWLQGNFHIFEGKKLCEGQR